MAMGAIELATIARSQDYTTIKQHEDNRGIAQQNHLVHNMQQENQQKTRQVNKGENPEWQQKKFDAKEKGNGSYAGDGGKDKRKKSEEDGKVFLKGHTGFDIKI